MTPEERDIISRFVQRVAGSPSASSVPGTQTALPPVDYDADSHLAGLFQQYPEARYRMTQFAFGQEQALQGAAQQIQALQQENAALRQQVQPSPQQPGFGNGQPAQGGGFFSRMFGGGQSQQAPYAQPYPNQGYAQQQPGFGAPPPGYNPGYGYGQQGMMAQRGGTGFLGSALTTAAGVAGGMLAFNAIEGLFTDHGAAQTAAGTFGADQGAVDNSGWGSNAADNSGWQTMPDQSSQDNSGWTDDSSGGGGGDAGWDDSGGGSDDWV